jgi:excisionase family DNA binding protein
MTAQPAGDELLTPAGVAALLYVDRKTVTRWAQTGKLASIRTPGGHRRYLRADVLAIRAGSFQHAPEAEARPDVRSPRPGGGAMQGGTGAAEGGDDLAAAVVAGAVAIALEAEAAETSKAVLSMASAVSAAAEKAAAAAERARGARASAASKAANTVAEEAAGMATSVRLRADRDARLVAKAAALAMQRILDSGEVEDPVRAVSRMGETVAAEGRASVQDTSRAAQEVATAVAAAAAHVAQMTLSADDAIERQVSSTADAMLQLTTDTANRVARETQARAAGVAIAAREAAAALRGQLPDQSHTPPRVLQTPLSR